MPTSTFDLDTFYANLRKARQETQAEAAEPDVFQGLGGQMGPPVALASPEVQMQQAAQHFQSAPMAAPVLTQPIQPPKKTAAELMPFGGSLGAAAGADIVTEEPRALKKAIENTKSMESWMKIAQGYVSNTSDNMLQMALLMNNPNRNIKNKQKEEK